MKLEEIIKRHEAGGSLLSCGILTENNISVNDITEFLKTHKITEYAMEQLIEYINMIGKNEKDIYIEIAKYYLDKNKGRSIKYLRVYAEKGGDNSDVILLLCKLLREEERFDEASGIAELLNNINEEVIREKIYVYGLSNKSGSEIYSKTGKLFEDMKKVNAGPDFINESMFVILNNKILKDGNSNLSGGDKWIAVIEKHMRVLPYDYYKEIMIRIIKYYTNEYIISRQDAVLFKLSQYIDGIENKDLIKSILFNMIDDIDRRNNLGDFYSLIKMSEETAAKIDPEYRSEIIEKIGEYYQKNGNLFLFVGYLCRLIEEDDADRYAVYKLCFVLRSWDYSYNEQEKILKILDSCAKSSRKPRAGNIFLNESEIIRKKTVLKSKPRIMIASVTTYCNFNCVMCGQNKDRPYEIDDEHAEYIKTNMPYFEEIRWNGGEVFLYKRFDELIELASKYGVCQEIITNGSLLNGKRLELLIKNNVRLAISLEAADKELYEKIRVNGKFDDLIGTLNAIKSYKKNIKNFSYILSSVIMTLNYKEIDKLIDFAISYGFQKIRFQKYMTHRFVEDLSLTIEQLREVVEKINGYKEKALKGGIPIEIESNIEFDDNINADLKKEKELLMRISGDYGESPEELERQYQEELKMRHQNENQNKLNNDSNISEDKEKISEAVPDNENKPEDKAEEPVKEAENKNEEKTNKLFCMAPWTTLAFFNNKGVKFSCVSDHTAVSKVKDIWNDVNVVKYREKIVDRDYTGCNKVCYELGIDGERTRLGI